eukprot:5290760-Pleurochrysis_carterae.AAC.1
MQLKSVQTVASKLEQHPELGKLLKQHINAPVSERRSRNLDGRRAVADVRPTHAAMLIQQQWRARKARQRKVKTKKPLFCSAPREYVERADHTALFYSGRIFIFGGRCAEQPGAVLNDFWEMAPGLALWTNHSNTVPPTLRPRARHQAVLLGSRMLIIGGHDGSSYLRDVWECDLDKLMRLANCSCWRQVSGDAESGDGDTCSTALVLAGQHTHANAGSIEGFKNCNGSIGALGSASDLAALANDGGRCSAESSTKSEPVSLRYSIGTIGELQPLDGTTACQIPASAQSHSAGGEGQTWGKANGCNGSSRSRTTSGSFSARGPTTPDGRSRGMPGPSPLTPPSSTYWNSAESTPRPRQKGGSARFQQSFGNLGPGIPASPAAMNGHAFGNSKRASPSCVSSHSPSSVSAAQSGQSALASSNDICAGANVHALLKVQSVARGIIARRALGWLRDDAVNRHDAAAVAQAYARGFLQRRASRWRQLRYVSLNRSPSPTRLKSALVTQPRSNASSPDPANRVSFSLPGLYAD